MFENFYHQINKELGPLNPDWFEELTAKATRDEGRPDSSKAEQEEDTVKAPETSALASQLYSTPKIFKQQQFQSPDSIPNEESPYEDLSAFPWSESSPCLFGSAKDRFDRSCEKPRDCFGLLETPKRSLTRSAKLISESLGAQINPDLSWTSSFNTPSSLTPTVILPKTEDRGPSSSGLKDKEAIFVRKLFPSLSKVSARTASLNDTTLKQDAKSETIHVDDLGENPVCSPNASLDTSGLWKQTVPSAIEDGDVRTTVQNVLDGAEDALSIFFSNSTSTLRRIKSKERIRRRISNSSKDVKSLVLITEPEEILKADVETKSPNKNKDIIQWTPLSLSESILNGGCSGPSLINNHNTVASNETNGCTVFNCTGESSQTFSQSGRLRSYPEEAERQKTLLDKSPAFMLTRKSRKFVYQVPSSDLSTTVIEQKAALPVCSEHTVKENFSVLKESSDLNKSRFASEYAINNQTQPQAVEPLSTEPHDFDHGLDMTQLSKAFAEDFTQEIRPGLLLDVHVKSDQNGQVQPKAEFEENKVGNHNDISNLSEMSVNSPNKLTVMLTTFDISNDSGCPTTFSDLDGTTASCADIKEFCPTFQTANNKAISVPSEAVMKAKASLDEAAGDGLSITLNQTTPKHYQTIKTLCKSVSGSSNATRSPVGQFVFPNHASITCVSDAPKSDSPKSFKMNISSYSSPQSNESDYKTGSKRNSTALDVSLQTETLLKEKLWRDSSKCINQKPDFKRSAERQTVSDINSTYKPTAVDSSRDDVEKNGTLTASQKADVTELCNLLEEANSQHEFTQFKPTNLSSENNTTTEREWDPDIVNGIDFDDSFNCDFVKGKHPVKKDSSSVNSSDHIQIVDAAKLYTMAKETRNGTVPLAVTEDNSVVDGLKNVLSNFTDNTQFNCVGFKTAEGKLISISEKSLNKAKNFFEEDDHEVEVDFGVIKSEYSETKLSANTSDSISTENKTHNGKKLHFGCVCVNAACKEINEQVTGMEQNCLGEKTDVFVDSNSHYGFIAAKGAKLKVSEKALLQARKLNDVDSLESQTYVLALHASGKHNASMPTTSLQKTKAVSWSEPSIKINQPDSVVVNQISDVSNIPSFSSENVFQEQKSSNDAKEVCANIFPSETFVPQSWQGYGFQTASGKGVSVSASALKKAKGIFKDCDSNINSLESANMEGKNDKLVEIVEQTNSSISNCKSVSFSNVVKAKTVLRDTDLINDFSLQSSLDQQPPQDKVCEKKGIQNEFSKLPFNGNCGFSTASGKKVSISAGALQRAKDVFSEPADVISCAYSSPKTKQVVDNQTDYISSREHKGFCTAGGMKVSVSATGLQRAKYLFRDCEEESLSSKDLQHQNCKGFSNVSEKTLIKVKPAFAGSSDIPFSHESETGKSSGKPVGFFTAGGKKVAISATALQRAKSLFNDCEEEVASVSLQHQACKGFSTASGRDVTVSEKALKEVRAAFAGCEDASFSHEPKNSSGNNVGFSTAGGKKVAISANALQRAKSLFNDCEEENVTSIELLSEKVLPQTKSSHRKSEDIVDENLKFEQLKKKNCGFSTASGKGVSVSTVALEEASKLFRDCDAQVTATDNQLLQSDFSKRCTQHKHKRTETTLHPLPSKVTPNIPAQLDLNSLDFNSCTDTQQEYFEQEAMACTEALLADDDLNESVKLVMSESTDYQKSLNIYDRQTQGSFDQNRRRKRQSDSCSIADSEQPPLKRQLLSEFDQTLDAKSSGLKPLKSCPNGTLKDRRVFKYNVILKPNVTAPDWHHVAEKSNDLEKHCSTVSVQNRRNSDTKGGVFLSPIQEVMMTGTSNCQNVSKVSSGFMPPFKKENKEKTDHSNQMDQKMKASTSHSDSYLHEGFKPKSTTSVESVVKIMNSEEKDTEVYLKDTLDLARDMQDMRLRKKKRQTIRPLPGSLYLARTSGVPRIGLRFAVGCKCPGQYTKEELYQYGVHQKVSKITSENAESFRFDCNDFFKRELLIESGAVQLADGGWLVPDSKGTVGKDEFYSALCDTPGVDPKLISDAWVFNHYRWIVWKGASMERTFPVLMGSLCLTPEQVLLQLKFRYDVEVDHSQRSALRRIMERDDTPAKTLVLCVCGVAKTCQNPEKPVKDEKTPNAKMESCVIWLTDGWYAIKGMLDPPLSAMLNKSRLRIGDKIVTSGAELVGSQEACSPLEAPESLMLKISANSTRRARWDIKLGYYRDPRPIRLQLSSLYPAGGVVSCVNIVVLRSYPTQWMEKKPNGVFIFRNDRAEEREARKHSNSKHKSMDLVISKIQTQFEKEMEGHKKSRRQRRTFSRHEIEALQDGEELHEAMEQDPAVETHVSERQMEAVSKYRRSLGERSQAELQERVQKAVMEAQEADGGCPNRDVTPVWKLSITDTNDLQNDRVYTLNIWRPSQDLYGLLREGHRYRAYHLATSEGKKRSGIAHIQLTATKKTLFQDIEVSQEWLHQHFRARECVRFRELQNSQFSSPCGEVDIVGYIVSIVGKQGNCPVLHLVDENFDLVSVRTYSSLEQLAVEELVKPRALIALSNLHVRPLSGPVPSLYAGEQALFSVNPKESHLQEALAHLKTFVQTCEEFFSIAEDKVSDVVPSGVLDCFQSPRTPSVQSYPKINGRVTPQQKSSSFSPFTPLNRRTPVSASNSEGKDPKNLKRRQGLDYLSRIPSPPPITPLKTRASPCVSNTFNPPRRSVTPKPPLNESPRASRPPPEEEEWVHDEELVMIDTQALLDGLRES
ncbi:breast cancer type 2 susceptibility protein [Siphateles boraxobius]|uniref:breast cancer type 2 susceptibility protein n=1 Tax=Siphateles boraxobius TaxID=180520 RepID=UPI0040647010